MKKVAQKILNPKSSVTSFGTYDNSEYLHGNDGARICTQRMVTTTITVRSGNLTADLTFENGTEAQALRTIAAIEKCGIMVPGFRMMQAKGRKKS